MTLGIEILPFELVRNILASKAFAVGALYGALAFLLTGVLAAVRRRAKEGAGLAFAFATYFAVRDVWGSDIAPLGTVAALVLLGLGGAAALRMRSRMWDRWYVTFGRTALALAPGAILLAVTFPVETPAWLRAAAGIGVLVTGVLAHDFDLEQGPRGAPFVLVAVSAVGVYYTVPDTELPLVLLGAAVPFALISFPQPLRRMGAAGTAALMGVFAWVIVVGGQGRAGSVVAGFATLGLLLVEPLARRIPRATTLTGKMGDATGKWGDGRRTGERWTAVVLVAALVQLTLCAYCATMAGREVEAYAAALMVTPALVLAGALAPTVLPLARKPRSAPSSRRTTSRSRAVR